LSLAEPGAMVAGSGGQYVFVRRGLGDFPGFVVGWGDWISTAASLSAASIVFAEYFAPFVPATTGHGTAVASGLVVLFALLNWRGIRTGDMAQQLLSALKAVLFAGLIVAGLLFAVPELGPPPPVTLPTGAALAGAIILGLQSVIYTYDGWTGPLYFGGEVKDPGRDIPRSMLGGVLAVIAIYLLLNLAMVRILGVERMAGDPFPASTAGRAIFGERSDQIVRILVLASIVGGLNALMLMVSRVPYAMASDRLLPSWFTEVNRGGTPTVAHWASVGIAIGFIVTGTFSSVLAIAAFFYVVNYFLSFASVFALRRREPDAPRPFRVPGYPWTTGVALLGSLAFLAGAIVTDWGNSWKALALIAASLPAFLFIRSRQDAKPAGES
ncbi:MAG: APC family permease, partial [Gemmatimonadota bacterium]|nr:APC family permease [Gemmatimonadota bacterium]